MILLLPCILPALFLARRLPHSDMVMLGLTYIIISKSFIACQVLLEEETHKPTTKTPQNPPPHT